jgi:hypothetical protein
MNILNIFRKKKKDHPFNIHHPDLADKVEFAFSAGLLLNKRDYYRFKESHFMPVGRFKFAEAFLYESELRMDLKTLNGYMDELAKNIDGSKGQINIEKCFQVIWSIRSRCKLAFSPEIIERLASVVYFDDTEDLSDLDHDYAAQKVKFWKEHDCISFFLTKPIIDLLNLQGYSETSFQTFIKEIRRAQELIENLTLGTEKPYLQSE